MPRAVAAAARPGRGCLPPGICPRVSSRGTPGRDSGVESFLFGDCVRLCDWAFDRLCLHLVHGVGDRGVGDDC